MAERSVSSANDHTLSADDQNFEHGVVSSDAVYVPRWKQSFRGQRGRGKLPGNQQNGSLDGSEYVGSKESRAGSKYGGGRGQRTFGQRGHYYTRRNPHSSAYKRNEASSNSSTNNCYSGSSAADCSTSADADCGMQRTHSDEVEYSAPSFHVREHVKSSRVSRNDHRYEEWSHSSRGARTAYRRGRGYRGASNYSSDDRLGKLNTQDVFLSSNNSREAVAGLEASAEADLRDVTKFNNSDRKKFKSKTQTRSSEKLITKDDNRTDDVRHGSHCIPDDQLFRDLHISTEVAHLPNDMPGKGNSRAVFDAKIKNTDPEFETQRGYLFVFLIILHVIVIGCFFVRGICTVLKGGL